MKPLNGYEPNHTWFRLKRFENGMSQTTAAKALGRHRSFISRFESGDRDMPLGDALEYAKVLGYKVTLRIEEEPHEDHLLD